MKILYIIISCLTQKKIYFYFFIIGKYNHEFDLFKKLVLKLLACIGKLINPFFISLLYNIFCLILYDLYFSIGDLNVYLKLGHILIFGNGFFILYFGFKTEKNE